MSKALAVNDLDHAVRPFAGLASDSIPRGGWIGATLRALGLPAKTLARRLGVGPAQVTRFVQREETGGISLASLRRVADALECDVVYAFVPRTGTFRDIVERQARRAAVARLAAAEHTMALEAQPVDPVERTRQLDELTRELLHHRPTSMWDVDPAP